MADFSFIDRYRRFEQAVTRKTRYGYEADVRDFLAAVTDTSGTRKDSIEKDSIRWRPIMRYTWRTENPGTEEEFEVPNAFGSERIIAKAEFVTDGLVNPTGIPGL